MHGHVVDEGATCPECGRFSTPAELVSRARLAARFRWWMTPVFGLPGLLCIVADHLSIISTPTQPLARAAVLGALYPIVWYALRDHVGPDRIGTAVVLTVFVGLTNNLLASLGPLLAMS